MRLSYRHAALLVAVLGILAAVLGHRLGDSMSPAGLNPDFYPRPVPAITHGNGGTPGHVDKVALIIMQNPECWTGIPGYVCDDDTATYAWGGFAGPRKGQP